MPHPQDLAVATTAGTTRFCRTRADPASPLRASQGFGAVRTTRLARRSRGSAQSIAPPCARIRDGAARVHRDPIRGS